MGNEGIYLITKIINNCYNTGELLEDYLSTTFRIISKVSGTQQCNEHQMIGLILHASKALLKVLNQTKPIRFKKLEVLGIAYAKVCSM